MIGNRLKKLEAVAATLAGRCCAVCASTPGCFVLEEADETIFARRMKEHAERCTCGRPFHVKVISIEWGGKIVKRSDASCR
jgi:hypothetical protein